MAAEDSDYELREGTVAKGLRWLGAALSVGFLAVVGYWGWSLYTRDVGEIPVIQAELGPMRIVPDDPGGTVAPHQGRAVNALISGEAETRRDVALAPAPIAPAEEDAPLAELATPLPVEEDPIPPAVTEAVTEEEPAAAPETDLAEAPTTDSAVAPSAAFAPRPRPASLRTTQPEPPAPVITPGSQEPLTADQVPAGTPLIQLGAFDSEQIAILQWVSFVEAHPVILGNLQRYIEPVNSGGATLFRLRAVGFADGTETRAACAALQSRGQDCIPTVKR
ncbi:hypothetical protein FHS89_002387 [Rubricella aquisinus]|uniref:SPOR domain-containing protein n=1 Tax=Rubricella aquisinus TaxID=2028108 RepID=A0A840X3F9_9RHOB|nr:SPOR domain-containing protein [Rubricella aquisinus]MBB5516356.1 hypothetical protein [Rubricella aquisinus]